MQKAPIKIRNKAGIEKSFNNMFTRFIRAFFKLLKDFV